MTRKRKKLKTRTNANVSSAAAALPASQRPLTERASFFELHRLGSPPAPNHKERAHPDEYHGSHRDCDARAAPAALAAGAAWRDRQHRRVGGLVAHHVSGRIR